MGALDYILYSGKNRFCSLRIRRMVLGLFLVGCLWYWFGLDFGWFNELRFIRGYSLKLDRRTVILGWHGSILRLEDIAIVLGILYWFNGVGLVLIFVWALADEGNLIQYFTLKLNDSYSITLKLWRRVYEIVNFLWHVSISITGFKGFWVVMPLLVFILRDRTTGGRYFDILIMISIGSRKIAFYSPVWDSDAYLSLETTSTTSTKFTNTLESLIMHYKVMIIMVPLPINTRESTYISWNKIKILGNVTPKS